MPKNYWDTERNVLVTPAGFHKYYGGMIVSGEINPEECSFHDYMNDCLGKNGTLISVYGAINANIFNDATEVIIFGIDKIAKRYGLKIDIDDYPDIDLNPIVESIASFMKATLLAACLREED